jgi:EAL domain-containing protein (putative c-di-GMP-specific phosphodiesterase class I)
VGCTNCEVVPGELPDGGRVFLWTPLGHTLGKLNAWAGQSSIARIQPRDGDTAGLLVLDVDPGTLGRLLVEMVGCLTEQELADVRALIVEGPNEPGFADFPRVSSLRELSGQQQAAWLRTIMRENRLFSLYQPIFASSRSQEPFGFEALSRARDTEGGVIPAGLMIDAAREAGLAFQLDLQARLNAVEGFRGAPPRSRLFINFSPTAIYDPAYCLRRTIARIDELGIARERVVFEVIESERHTNIAHLRGILAHYRRNGFTVALDDFGAGFNSLTILEQLQPDIVKFDMGLIHDVDTDSKKSTILENLTNLCRRLGARTLAEGIETEGELSVIKDLGIDYLQGFLLGRPSPLPAL